MMHLPLATRNQSPVIASRKLRWWHESLVDYMLANPGARQNDIAKHFGRTPATISVIIHTDAFKAYYNQRRAVHQADLGETVRTKLMNVADVSLDAILDKLEKKRDTLPLEMLQRTTEMTLKALGYGAQSGPSVVVNNNPATTTINVPSVSLADLEVARAALRNSQQQSLAPPTVEAEFTVIDEAALGRGATTVSPNANAPLGARRDDSVASWGGAGTISPPERRGPGRPPNPPRSLDDLV